MEPSAYALSPFKTDEQLYLKFIYDDVSQQLTNQQITKTISPIFIATNKEINDSFIEFIQENYKKHIITDVNYSIRKTLFNVYKLTKCYIEHTLNESDLKDESQCQSRAYSEIAKIRQFGRVLTERQAKTILFLAKKVNIPCSKNLIEQSLPPLLNVEKLYLKFIHNAVRNSIKERCTSLFLGASMKMLIDFSLFAKNKKVNLFAIINRLTDRARQELKSTIDPLYIKDEARQQKFADANLAELKNLNGRMLTLRQAKILANYAEQL